MTENNIQAAIEALLFASEKPLALEQIRGALDNIGADEIRKNIAGLSRGYERDNRGIRIIEIAGGFQMITAPVFVTFLKKLYKKQRAEKLSLQALETLAIVAYKQPVTRLEIESIRNVNVDGMVSGLLEKNLIRVAGRKKAPGRPKVYGTTRQFLEHFGLKSLDELPKIEDFIASQSKEEKSDANNRAVALAEAGVKEEKDGLKESA
ncbi:MAG: SMC-Scp complex subunit ScpB [Candidatus Omnitrophica bacterium]|nr:SMC-Scp complex subunit ScpB [Candidatus Omnitrophota bacterium]MDD5592562.1 SMC-Scp complex subunit ScpB [Candidatus Omnitrophota bacterium]